MTTTQIPLGNFIVKRDAQLDPTYNAQLIAAERKQAINEAFLQLRAKSLSTASRIGRGLVNKLVDIK